MNSHIFTVREIYIPFYRERYKMTFIRAKVLRLHLFIFLSKGARHEREQISIRLNKRDKEKV